VTALGGNRKAGLLHHVELYVSELSNTKKFWGWLLEELGYENYQSWEEGNSWKHGETYIVFVQVKEKYKDISYHRCGVGLNHLAFHAESREQVDQLTLRLQELGVKLLYQDRHPYAGGENYYAVFFEDPDRIKVEIVAP
jgi:catechol 2,3-dioxygenase-like lactoylglutathione lyase family enzyme